MLTLTVQTHTNKSAETVLNTNSTQSQITMFSDTIYQHRGIMGIQLFWTLHRSVFRSEGRQDLAVSAVYSDNGSLITSCT